jgi:hypothetical protein
LPGSSRRSGYRHAPIALGGCSADGAGFVLEAPYGLEAMSRADEDAYSLDWMHTK